MSYFPCPKTKCEGILDLKQAKRGASKGEYFYGCTNFSNSLVNCKVTVNKEDILNYLHSELFGSKKIPTPSNKVIWKVEELEKFNSKQLVMICSNNGYDVGYEDNKENLINLINYFQTSYYKLHYGDFVFSKVISTDYLLSFNYLFSIDELREEFYDDLALKIFLSKKSKGVKILDYLNNVIGEASFSKNSIDLKFAEGISGGNGFELLTMIDLAKSYCKCFIISGEATLEIFNTKDEQFFNSN